jgi:hypothetical protein
MLIGYMYADQLFCRLPKGLYTNTHLIDVINQASLIYENTLHSRNIHISSQIKTTLLQVHTSVRNAAQSVRQDKHNFSWNYLKLDKQVLISSSVLYVASVCPTSCKPQLT